MNRAGSSAVFIDTLNGVKRTGEGHGDALAELDFSNSSGSSTEFMRMFRALSSRRLWTGLDGAERQQQQQQKDRNDHILLCCETCRLEKSWKMKEVERNRSSPLDRSIWKPCRRYSSSKAMLHFPPVRTGRRIITKKNSKQTNSEWQTERTEDTKRNIVPLKENWRQKRRRRSDRNSVQQTIKQLVRERERESRE